MKRSVLRTDKSIKDCTLARAKKANGISETVSDSLCNQMCHTVLQDCHHKALVDTKYLECLHDSFNSPPFAESCVFKHGKLRGTTHRGSDLTQYSFKVKSSIWCLAISGPNSGRGVMFCKGIDIYV